MSDQLCLLCVTAHPDDEALGFGGVLAKYAAEGIAVHVLCATRGEYGWHGAPADNPGPLAMGRLREAELRAATDVLGAHSLHLLPYIDGRLDQADPDEIIAAITVQLRRLRPQVVVTFAADGATGHPDHIAISQFTSAAIVCATDQHYAAARDWPAHRVAKLYHLAETRTKLATYDAIFGDSAMDVDGQKRSFGGWPDWAISASVDASAYWRQVWQAIRCHRSQLPGYAALRHVSEAQHRYLWGCQEYYRVFSVVNGGRPREDDLFAGLRRPAFALTTMPEEVLP